MINSRRPIRINHKDTKATKIFFIFFVSFVSLWFISIRAFAQTPEKSPQANLGVIAGQVLRGNGRPFADVTIFVRSQSGNTNRATSTNSNGNFRVTKLPSGDYSVIAYAPGYFAAPDASIKGSGPKYYHIGDSLTITLIKGGVITGKVADPSGKPVIGARVRAVPANGVNDLKAILEIQSLRERLTDDRGIYRIYGLEPGTYLVAASGSGGNYKTQNTVSTYFPSTTLAGATKIIVTPGEETAGIDIRYPSERGRTISGSVSGSASADKIVELIHAQSGTVEATSTLSGGDARSFSFYGVPDGEYELKVRGPSDTGPTPTSRKVVVKGTDITGLQLK
jgi:hypothetical protein